MSFTDLSDDNLDENYDNVFKKFFFICIKTCNVAIFLFQITEGGQELCQIVKGHILVMARFLSLPEIM